MKYSILLFKKNYKKIINNKGVVGHSGASLEEGIYLKASLY